MQNYKYFAFVSYSHKDQKWAKWIHKALEHYRLPAAMRAANASNFPKKIAPVFLDSADLGAGVLTKLLPEELDASRNLVVICSPNSARPNEQGINWIDLEVSHFCDSGKTDKVIPVIVDGLPATAFCPRLNKEGILAIDATKQKKKRVLNDIVAALLDLRPDDLWKREIRRTMQRWALGLLAGLLGVVLSVSGIVWYQDEYCDHVEYFFDYVNDWCVPQGLQRLTEAEINQRAVHYRFVYNGYEKPNGNGRKRRLRSISCCDSNGRLFDGSRSVWFNRPAKQFLYYDDEKLVRKTYCDSFGREQYSLVLSDQGIWTASGANFDAKNWIWGGEVFGWDYLMGMFGLSYLQYAIVGKLVPEYKLNSSAKSFYLSEYDAQGNPTRIDFLPNNQSRTAMPNKLGAYGERYTYDASGRLTSVRFLDSAGNPFVKTNVFAGIDIEYSCLTTTVVSVDAARTPVANNKGWVCQVFIRGENGNLLEHSCLDKNFEICDGPKGIARVVCEYDESGTSITRCLRYSANGELILPNIGWAIEDRKCGNNKIDIYYKDDKGNDFMMDGGYSHILKEWQDETCITRYYIGDGTPVLNEKTLAHQEVATRAVCEESDGSCVYEVALYGTKREPKIGWEGCSNVITRVGPYGLEFVKMKPAVMGNVSELRIDRELRFGKVSKIIMRSLNAYGKPAAWCWNSDPALVGIVNANSNNYDSVEATLDEYGRMKNCRAYNSNGKGEVAICNLSYGENGLVSSIMTEDRGFAIEYNDVGVSSVTFLGADMMPTNVAKMDIARAAFEYDDYGHVKWIRCFSANNVPRLCRYKNTYFAALHMETAANGDVLFEERFDERMNPIAYDGVYCQKHSYERNGAVKTTTTWYLDKDGKTPVQNVAGYHKVIEKEKSNGQPLERSFYGLDCQSLALNENGFARLKEFYDERGRFSGQKYYDDNDILLVETKWNDMRVIVPMVRYICNRYGLYYGDVLVAVDGKLCFGNPELAKSLTQGNASQNLVVARPSFDGQDIQLVNVTTPGGDSVINVEVFDAQPKLFEAVYNKYLQLHDPLHIVKREFSFSKL